jgi:hypothetical protein
MQVFKITLNRELSTKLIPKNSLASTAHESQFSDKQKFHSTPKQRRPFSTKTWATDSLYCDYKEQPHLFDDLHS